MNFSMQTRPRATENKSRETLHWYRKRLGHFSGFVGGQATVKDLNLSNARSFIASLQSRNERYTDHPIAPTRAGGLSEPTIHAYVRALKALSNWAFQEWFTTTNALDRLRRPSLPKVIISTLTDDEIKALVGSVNPNCMLGARGLLIVVMLLDTGLRANELLGLTLGNTDLSGDRIKVTGKGNKERIVPLGPSAKKVLLRWISTFRPEPQDPQEETVVLSAEGTPLSYTALAHIIKRLGQKAGVHRLHAHLFRHTFAVRYLVNGGDLMTLRNILGHSDITTTQVYLHLADARVAVRYNSFSPLSNLDIKIGGRSRRL
ncbi:MAG: tyrosine-type recombinase/integrase [Anaerolineae bacterium]